MKLLTARPHRLLALCIDRIGALAARGERCMLLVPSQFTLQAELEVMEQLKLEGSFLIDVLSPGRLRSRVFERAGQPERVIFDERGKCMILSDVLAEVKDELTIYRNAAQNGSMGLIARMSALIADLKRSGCSADRVLESANEMDDGTAARKLRDAAHIYARYEAHIKGRLADEEDIQKEMCAKLSRSGVLKDRHVVVYGFDMITPSFAEQLIAWDREAASVTVAIETDANSAPDGRLFAPVNFSLQRLNEMAAEAGRCVEREHVKAERRLCAELNMLESSLFALGGAAYAGRPEVIELHAASGMYNEVHMAASRIRALLADGEDSSGIAVVYPKGSGYGALLHRIMPQYGLTAYVAEKRPAAAHPLCRLILSALAVVAGGWKPQDVMECIRTGFFALTPDEADALCGYIESMDLRGTGMQKPLVYVYEETEEQLEMLETARKKAAEPLMTFARDLTQAHTADDTVAAVIALLEGLNAYETLLGMRDALCLHEMHSEAEDCVQVWNGLMDVLDQLHELIGEKAVPAERVLRLLESGISGMELAALPPADGAVICGEIGNIRTGRIENLFAIGVNDSAGSAGEGLFSAMEQEQAVQATGAYLGMTAAERAALGQLDQLKMFSGAQKRVIFSYALSDETGRALREDACLQALRRCFPQLNVQGGMPGEEAVQMLTAPAAAMEALAVHLSEAADDKHPVEEPFRQAYALLAKRPKQKEALHRLTRELGSIRDPMLDGAQARTLYGRPIMTVSRLETFARCPYRHFIHYGLSPAQERQPGIDRAELGTLYHEAAERFTKEVISLPEFPDVSPETCAGLMDRAVEPLITHWKRTPLGESARGEAYARRIRGTARRTAQNILRQYVQGDFTLLTTEMNFGRNGAAPIVLELEGGGYTYLMGRIDRIDVWGDDAKHIRVIDYKSGTKSFDPTQVYWGLQLQLLLYLSAAMSELPGMEPAGFFYCRIADPLIRSEERLREEVEKQIAKKLSLAGISLSDVTILQAQGSEYRALIKADGTLSGRAKSRTVDAEGMRRLVRHAKTCAGRLASQAYAGVIAPYPAMDGSHTACETCDYAAICGFDPTIRPKHRLKTKKLEDLCRQE